MNTALRFNGSHGIILFLFLIAFAMVQISSSLIFFTLIFLAPVLYVLPTFAQATGYLAVALTVSKIE